MPHKCTKCEEIFNDGDDAILKGCPNCGWNKFYFIQKNSYNNEESNKFNTINQVNENSKENNDNSKLCPFNVYNTSSLAKKKHKYISTEDTDNKSDTLEQPEPEIVKNTLNEKDDDTADERIETIRINEPGSYELNLGAMFERDEIVMGLKQKGKYALHIPSVFDK